MKSAAEEVASPEYRRAKSDLSRFLYEGNSWSGRERNCLFLNLGMSDSPGFTNASAVTGFDFMDDGRGIGLTDWDGDGDLDVWMSCRTAPQMRFLKNNSEPGKGWLGLRLQGDGERSNRDAIGARVTLTLEKNGGTPNTLIRTVHAGGAYLSQSSKTLHFGLGRAKVIAKMDVRWPDGRTESFVNIAAGKRYEIVQGSGRLRPLQPAGFDSKRLISAPETVAPASDASRVLMLMPPPLPPMNLDSLDGKPLGEIPPGDSDGKTMTLVNLWASWCTPCLAELNTFHAQREKLAKAGIRVLALNVDGLAGDPDGSIEAARKVASRFPATESVQFHRATEAMVKQWALFAESLFITKQELPVPSSFLVDPEGNCAALYLGPVEVDALIGDVAAVRQTPGKRLSEVTPFSGKWYAPEFQNIYDRLARAFFQVGDFAYAEKLFRKGELWWKDDAAFMHDYGLTLQHLGKWQESVNVLTSAQDLNAEVNLRATLRTALGNSYRELGYIELAAEAYRQSIAIQPSQGATHRNLGLLLARNGKVAQALEPLRQVTELVPGSADAWNDLGLAHALLGNGDLALKTYKRGLTIAPRHAGLLNNSGYLAEQSGDLDQAEAAYRAALNSDPSHGLAKANLQRIVERRRSPLKGK